MRTQMSFASVPQSQAFDTTEWKCIEPRFACKQSLNTFYVYNHSHTLAMHITHKSWQAPTLNTALFVSYPNTTQDTAHFEYATRKINIVKCNDTRSYCRTHTHAHRNVRRGGIRTRNLKTSLSASAPSTYMQVTQHNGTKTNSPDTIVSTVRAW